MIRKPARIPGPGGFHYPKAGPIGHGNEGPRDDQEHGADGYLYFRSAAGLRFITAPPPRCVSMYTACGGISATGACHSPDDAFDPNHGLPMTRTTGTTSYAGKPLSIRRYVKMPK